MGCGGSTPADPPGQLDLQVEEPPPPVYEKAEEVSNHLNVLAHERLRKLKELDQATKIPFILIELTGEGDGHGEIEVCGKDEYGIYEALDGYFKKKWGCEWSDPGSLELDTQIPFCSARYLWPGFKEDTEEDINNMGKSLMQLVDFVGGRLSWSLAVVNSGNVGKKGEVRETQIIFKAPHPMNLVVPTLMIEMRSQGYLEVVGDLDDDEKWILDDLEAFFMSRFKAERREGFDEYCDRYYKTGEDVFKGTSGSTDSNFGLLSVILCDQVVANKGWSLVSCSSGNTGESGECSEQTFIFRKDLHPLGDSPYIMVVLNASGNVEVNGKESKETRGVLSKLERFLKDSWSCKPMERFQEGNTKCMRFSWDTAADMLGADADIITFFEMQGFETQVCTQYMIQEGGQTCLEQQLFFRPGKTEVGTVEPHLVLELFAGDGSDELFADEKEPTQVLANSHIRYKVVAPKEGHDAVTAAIEGLDNFVLNFLGGDKSTEKPDHYNVNMFMCRGWYENNLAQWTMRVCDFVVDTLGWGFVGVSLSNSGEHGQLRTQQLLFHYEGDKRDMPVSAIDMTSLKPSQWKDTQFPYYWTIPKVIDRQRPYDVTEVSPLELNALQQICDATFKRVLTRDRPPDDDAPDEEEMPYRLEVVAAFRSEHAWLHHLYTEKTKSLSAPSEDFAVKTKCKTMLDERLGPGESYLFHGTNPSAAWSIMKGGFALRHAGSATGTMYGNGIYMAECSSKSDEYGRDDGGNTFPGLNALLVCRSFVGTPHVVDKAGDHVSTAKSNGSDCVCGDRETAGPKTYRELVFFDEKQLYPEYTIIYRRQWDADKVPDDLGRPGGPTGEMLSKKKPTGTTGRFWQMRGDIFGFKGWKNVPPEVNKILIATKQRGIPCATIALRGRNYIWNIHEKTVGDAEGTSPLRAPMQ
jgi:hypothetical protein